MAATRQFAVSNNVLKNESFAVSHRTFANKFVTHNAFSYLGDRGLKSQTPTEYYDETTDVIFYSQVNLNAIGCWNVKKHMRPENTAIVTADSEKLICPFDIKITDGNFYVLSNRAPLFLYFDLRSDANYRVMTGKTSELISGTVCA